MKNLPYQYLLLTLLCLLTACQPPISKTDYFPLQKGLTWHYQVTTALKSKAISYQQYQITNTGLANIDTRKLDPQYQGEAIYARRTNAGTDYYMLKNVEAVYRIAKRSIVEQQPRFDLTPRIIIPNADIIEIGDTWSYDTQAYAIYAIQPHLMRKDIGSKLTMLFQVSSVNETVTVPAGRFENCIKIVGSAEFSFFADAVQGYQTVPVTQTEWYAPAVGLVKLERSEDIDLSLFKGGKISYQLTHFSD